MLHKNATCMQMMKWLNYVADMLSPLVKFDDGLSVLTIHTVYVLTVLSSIEDIVGEHPLCNTDQSACSVR